MKHRNLWGCILLSGMLLISCRKQEPAVQSVPGSGSSNIAAYAKEGGGLCVSKNIYTLTQTNGEYSCPSGTGCSKISKCESVKNAESGGPNEDKIQEAHINQFLDAMANNDLQHYFSTNKWHTLFPGLSSMPGLLAGLQNGSYTFVKHTNSQGSSVCPDPDVFYMAVPVQSPGTTPGAPAYTLMVPGCTL